MCSLVDKTIYWLSMVNAWKLTWWNGRHGRFKICSFEVIGSSPIVSIGKGLHWQLANLEKSRKQVGCLDITRREVRGGVEPPFQDLQSHTLPLCYPTNGAYLEALIANVQLVEISQNLTNRLSSHEFYQRPRRIVPTVEQWFPKSASESSLNCLFLGNLFFNVQFYKVRKICKRLLKSLQA